MIFRKLLALVIAGAAILATAGADASVRLKDLVEFDGVRGNDLLGYGLVVGLNGTGDSLRNAPFTEDMMSNILERLGVNVTGEQFRPRNVAAVIVTASLPPFARSGGRVSHGPDRRLATASVMGRSWTARLARFNALSTGRGGENGARGRKHNDRRGAGPALPPVRVRDGWRLGVTGDSFRWFPR